MEKFTKVFTATVDHTHLNRIIKTAAKFVGSDTLRPALTGLFFEFDSIHCTVTGCDAAQLYSARAAVYTAPAEPFTVILEPGTLKKALQRGKFEISAAIHYITDDEGTRPDNSYNAPAPVVTVNGAPVLSYSGYYKYPEYRRVIPENNCIRYTFNRDQLIRTARAGAHISGGEKNPKINHNYQIIYDFNNAAKGSVKFLSCELDNHIEIAGTIGATWPGSDKIPDAAPAPKFGRISFNGHLLADTLQALECDSITLLMERPNRGVILETGDDSETVLIMPLLIGE